MPKKTNIFILLLLLAVFTSGCQAFSGAKEDGIPDTSYVFKGTEGLVISFFDGAPPDRVFPGSRIQVALLLENRGAVAIPCNTREECGEFLVFSKSPIVISEQDSLFTAVQDTAVQELDKRLSGKESYVSGGMAAHSISNVLVETPSKSTSSLIFAAACYPYKTKLSTPVCVDTAPFILPKEQRVCNLDDLRLTSQGAPVAIRKIVQSNFITVEKGPDGRDVEVVRPHLRIFVENAGKGIVLERSPESFNKACTSESLTQGIDKLIIGKISVESADVSGKEMKCNDGRPFFTLSGDSKKDFIECIVREGQGFARKDYENNFISTFNIVLSYGYQSAASKEVEVAVIEREDEAT
ncbi:hypothetical protein J4470_01750 [Candidatus Woesearchaeota archaeon]|nr:hypothetical protein [Candidatus Woesearchaeota archaeon]